MCLRDICVIIGFVLLMISCVIGVFGSDVRVIVWMYFFVVVRFGKVGVMFRCVMSVVMFERYCGSW